MVHAAQSAALPELDEVDVDVVVAPEEVEWVLPLFDPVLPTGGPLQAATLSPAIATARYSTRVMEPPVLGIRTIPSTSVDRSTKRPSVPG
jgi:hypothetical protein